MENKYYFIKSRQMANALVAVGFAYKILDDNNNTKTYSFVDTESFREALTILTDLRNKNNKRR